MKKLRNRFENFCYRNRQKGIPNLMLYITIGSALVYLMSMFDGSNTLYYALCFNRAAILQGQIWRLFTYAFTYDAGSLLFTTVGLFCYFTLGRAMENLWGAFKFNLFYLSGIILQDIFCMIFGGVANVSSLNMSLFLGFATLYPNTRFLLFFIIPIKAWIFAVIDIGLVAFDVFRLTAAGLFPYSLFPLISLLNYFLFFGRDVLNIFPFSIKPKKAPAKKAGTIPFPAAAPAKPAYTHKCTVCGRTDVSNPELEFRYCSRCQGYHCYCSEHISDHTHI